MNPVPNRNAGIRLGALRGLPGWSSPRTRRPNEIRALICSFALLFIATSQLGGAQTENRAGNSEGRQLAAELRSMAPVENAYFHGVLTIRRGERTEEIGVTSKVLVKPDHWEAVYQSSDTRTTGSQKLTVIHTPDCPNRYLVSRAPAPGEPMGEEKVVTGPELATPFAGSDFWLLDLGLDFIHWPDQRVLRHEMRRGRPSKVLESRPAPGAELGYSRVVSWIDNETGQPILAEAYDVAGTLLKEFKVKSVQKVEGRWQLGEIEIRNARNDSRTNLEFSPD